MSDKAKVDLRKECSEEAIQVICHCNIERKKCDKCKYYPADVHHPLNTLSKKGETVKLVVRKEWDLIAKEFIQISSPVIIKETDLADKPDMS